MSENTPPSILRLDALFQRLCACVQRVAAEVAEADAELKGITGRSYSRVRWDPVRASHDIKQIARTIANEVVSVATVHLSRPGLPARIDEDAYLQPYEAAERAIRDRLRGDDPYTVEDMCRDIDASWAAFRPCELWSKILADHSPEQVAQQAIERAAATLVDGFRLAMSAEPRVQAGRVEVTLHLYFQRDSRGLYLGGAGEHLVDMARAFQTFVLAAFPGEHALASALFALANTRVFHPRDRIDLHGGIKAVVTLAGIKLYLPQPVAEALNAFVTLHAADRVRRAAA